VTGFCKNGNDPSGSVNCEEFIDYLIAFELLKKASAP
jgi:hypothetical protein